MCVIICSIADVFDKIPEDKRTQAEFAMIFTYPVIFVLSIPHIYKYLAGGIKTLLNYKVWTEKE